MTPTSSIANDRAIRQRDLVPPLRLASCWGLVIGVGAIGRQVATQLAAMGMPALDLIDPDVVAVENLAPQGYWPPDLGKHKVERTADLCRSINPDLAITAHPDFFRRSSARTLNCLRLSGQRQVALFCCVDSITTRQLVWESSREQVAFFVDGRMAAEVIRVLAVGRPATDQDYATTLFAANQAYGGTCTAKSTIYTASIAAGLMVGQFTRWLRDLPVEPDQTLNLLSSELTIR